MPRHRRVPAEPVHRVRSMARQIGGVQPGVAGRSGRPRRPPRQVRSASLGRPVRSAWPPAAAAERPCVPRRGPPPGGRRPRRRASRAAPRPSGPRSRARWRDGRTAGGVHAIAAGQPQVQGASVPVGGPVAVLQLLVHAADRLHRPAGRIRVARLAPRLQGAPVPREGVVPRGPPRASRSARFSSAAALSPGRSGAGPRPAPAVQPVQLRRGGPGCRNEPTIARHQGAAIKPPGEGVQLPVGDRQPLPRLAGRGPGAPAASPRPPPGPEKRRARGIPRELLPARASCRSR